MKPTQAPANESNKPKHVANATLRRRTAEELGAGDAELGEGLIAPQVDAHATAVAAAPSGAPVDAAAAADASDHAGDADLAPTPDEFAPVDGFDDATQVAQADAPAAAGQGAGAAGGAGAGAGAAGASGAGGAAGAAGAAASFGAAGTAASAVGAGALVSAGFVLPAALAAAAGTVALASGSSGSDSHVASAPPAAAATAPTTTVSAIDISADTGASASDFITSQAGQTVTAQLSAALGAGETLWGSLDNGATWVQITDKAHGTAVSWDGATLVAGGGIKFEVRNATGAGPAAAHAYTLDTGVAAPSVALETDSGISAVDHTTNHATLSIGNVEAGGVVQYSIDGGTTWTSGFAAIEGVNDVQVRVTDVAGNVSAATSFSFTLDTSVAAPTVALVAERSGTAGTGEHVTDQGTLNVGNLEAGAVVQYSIDGGATWLSSFTAVEGSNNLQVRTVDVAGNVSAATPFSFTLDTSVPDTSRPDTILNGTVTAGPVIEGNGLHVVAYRSDGTVLVDGEVSAVGTFTLNVPGSYTGPVLVMVFDTSAGADYFDEATGKPKDLGSDLRAATVIPAPGTYHVNINALTELAVRSLGLAGGDGGSAGFDLSHFDPAQITAANQAVAAALGLGGQDLVTGPAPHAIIDANGASDPTADAYGKMLAALSGAELNAGSLDAALQALGAQLSGGSLSNAGLAQLVAGAARVGTALVDAISQITNHATSVAIGSVAEDNTVNLAEAAGVVTVSGTCAAGATVTLLVGDQTIVARVTGTTWSVDLQAGEFSHVGEGAVVLVATATLDGVSQVAIRGIYIDTVAPSVPTLDAHDTTDTTPVLTGSADALTTLRVEVGGAVYRIAVGADGHWSLDTGSATPISGTFNIGPDGLKNVGLTSTDAAGNATPGSGNFALDATGPAAPSVALEADSGSSASDHVTNAGTLVLGNVETGATVEYSTDGGTTWTSAFSAVEGINNVQVRVTDALGRQATTAFSFTLDTQIAAPSVGLVVDSANPSDALTNDGRLDVGNVEAGAKVEYSTDGGATWTAGFTPVEGANAVLVRATDLAGNVSAPTAFAFTLDTMAPPAPAVALAVDSANPEDAVTNDGRLTLGNVEAGATVEYSIDGGTTWTTAFAAVEGVNHVEVRVTDAAGNHAVTDFNFTLDTQIAAPTVALATDSGRSAADAITNAGSLTLGNVEAGSLVEYSTDGGIAWATGFTPVQGLNAVLVRATDAAGNQSAATAFSFTLDTQAPAAPSLALASDTGASASDHITHDGTLSLGPVEAGALVEYSTDGGTTWTTSFSASEGANNVLVRATDVAGNSSAPTALAFTLDTQIAAPAVALASDSGASATDHITNQGTITLGNVEPGAVVEYSTDGGTTWLDGFLPVEGVNNVQVRVTDVAGNQAVTPFAFTLDTTAPAALQVALQTNSGSTEDSLTNVGTLNVGGLEAGAVVQYSVDGGVTWTASFGAIEGVNNVLVRATDTAGNHGTATPFSFTLDSQIAPPTVALVTDSGVSASDHLTNVGTLVIGNVESGASVTYSIDGGTTWTSSFSAVEGQNNVLVRATDAAGNQAATAFGFVLDTMVKTPSELSVPQGSQGVEEAERVAGVAVDVPFRDDVRAGDVITLRLDDPTTNTPVVRTYTVTQQDVDAGHAVLTLAAADMPIDGVYGVSATITDRAGNVSNNSATSFTLLPALTDDECTVFDLARRDYHASDPRTNGAADSNVFVMTHGLSYASPDALAIYGHQFDLYTGLDLNGATITQQIGAAGLDMQFSGALDGHHYVVGAAAFGTSPDTNFIWANSIDLAINSTDNGDGAAYLLASAAGDGATEMAGAFEVSAFVQAAGTATAGGAVVANAGDSPVSGGNAQVEACDVTVVAIAGGNATAHLGGQPDVLGTDTIAQLSNEAGIGAYAQGGGDASVAIHEDVGVGAMSFGGSADASIGGIIAEDLSSGGLDPSVLQPSGMGGIPSHATVDIGGNVMIQAIADSGLAAAHLTGAIAALGGSGSAQVNIGGNVDVLAGGNSLGADASIAAVMASASHTSATGHVGIGGIEIVANAASGSTSARIGSLKIVAGSSAAAGIDIAQGIHISADGSSHALAELGNIELTAASSATALLGIGGDIDIEATASSGAASAQMNLYANASGSEGLAQVTIGGDVLVSAIGETGAKAALTFLGDTANGIGSQARIEVDNIVVHAHAASGTATASMSYLYAFAMASGAQASLRTLGDVTIEAEALAGSAHAAVSTISAKASFYGATAQVSVGGDVLISADGSGGANVQVTGVSAYASAVNAQADTEIGGRLKVEALATSGSAHAALNAIVALANADVAVAHVTIGGDGGGVVVSADGQVGAHANLGYVDATVSTASAQANVEISGPLSVKAHSSSGSATASLGSVFAGANSGSVARVTIGGNLDVHAEGNAGAHATVGVMYASARSFSAEADVVVSGNLEVQAIAASGSAHASMSVLYAKATSSGSVASFHVGHDVVVSAVGANNATAALDTVVAAATSSAAQAVVHVGGSLEVLAHATSGSATATLHNVYATAGSGGEAQVVVDGDLVVQAEGSTGAIASLGYVYATASATGGDAHVTVGGNIAVQATATSGTASATMIGPVAVAAYGSAIAQVDIGGDVRVSATGASGASATLSDVYASGQASQSFGRVSIVGDVVVHASATSGAAHAAVYYLEAAASVTAAQAQVDVGGNFEVSAVGTSGATATLSSVYAAATGSSAVALLSVGGDLKVDAQATSGSASVSMSSIYAEASGSGAVASLSVAGDISISAVGSNGADVDLDDVFAEADGSGAQATLHIGGDLIVTAQAVSGSASVSVSDIFASAGSSAMAQLVIGGDLKVDAQATSGSASVSMSSIYAKASGSGAAASLSVVGDISVSAAGSSDADVDLDEVFADADGYGAQAVLHIGGDLVVTAQATSGSASVSVSDIYASAGSSAMAQLVIGGDLKVDAQATSGSASVSMSSIYAKASGSSAAASLDVVGDISVSAAGSSDADVDLDKVFAEADGSGAQALLHIGGDVIVTAQATSGSASVSVSSVYASAGSSAVAQLVIGGDLIVKADGASDASASIGNVYAIANGSGGEAHLTVGGNITVQADATSGSASATLSGVVAYASSSSAIAQVDIGGDVLVNATGSSSAHAKLGNVIASAMSSESIARLSIVGDVAVHANASSGSAVALVSYIEANASSSGAHAQVDIGGNVEVVAIGTIGATAVLDSVYAHASYSGAIAHLSIGGDLIVKAETASGSASVSMSNVFARASSSNAQAQVDVGGNISITAVGASRATAAMSSLYARADGSGAQATFHIGGDFVLSAAAQSGSASASMSSVFAGAHGDHATAQLTIDDDFSVAVSGRDAATLQVSTVSANADGLAGHAELVIGGNLELSAATQGVGAGSASVSFYGISASVSSSGVAAHSLVDIEGDVRLAASVANGRAGASAGVSVYELNALALAANAQAHLVIGGDFDMSALAWGKSSIAAKATMSSNWSVLASADGALAQLDIGGDVNVVADAAYGGDHGLGALTGLHAAASFYSANVKASGNLAQSHLNIAGNVDVTAHGDGGANSLPTESKTVASAAIGSFSAVANGAGAIAQIEIGGRLHAFADGGIGSGGNVSACMTGLSATATGAGALAQVTVVGDIDIAAQRQGAMTHVKATVCALNASADSGGHALVTIGGDVLAHAQATGASAHANASFGSTYIFAHGLTAAAKLGAQATVDIAGDVTIDADVSGTAALAYALNKGVSASAATGGNGEAQVTIGGDVDTDAHAVGSQAGAHAVGSSFSANAAIGGSAIISVAGNVAVHADASGATAHATASFSGFDLDANGGGVAAISIVGNLAVGATATNPGADAHAELDGFLAEALAGSSASANVHIGGNVDVTAVGNDQAGARFGDIEAHAEGSGNDVSEFFGGHLHVSATGDAARAQMYDVSAFDETDVLAGVLAKAGLGANAHVYIAHDVELHANGQSEAIARQGGFSAQALSFDTAAIALGGEGDANLVVSAMAATSNASAVLGQYSHYSTAFSALNAAVRDHGGLVATAGNVSGVARIDIEGDVSIGATGGNSARAALYGVSAYGGASGASANVGLSGNLSVVADGASGDARVDVYNLHASGAATGVAAIDIGGNVTISGTGAGDANVFGGIWSAIGTNASLHVDGDVDMAAHAGGNVSLQAGYFADEGGSIDAGNVNVDVTSSGGDSDAADDLVYMVGAYDGGNLHMDSLAVNFDASGGTGLVFLGADSDRSGLATGGDYTGGEVGHDAGSKFWSGTGNNDGQSENVDIDALSLHAGAGADLTVWVDHMAWTADHTATLSGAGDISFLMYDPVFAVIDAGNLAGSLQFAEMLAPEDRDLDNLATSVNGFDYTVIKGFDVAKDTIGFGDMQADVGTWRDLVHDGATKHDVDGINYGITGNVNVVALNSTYTYTTTTADGGHSAYTATITHIANAGNFNTDTGLIAGLNAAIDGNISVAYAKYEGNLDLAGTLDVTNDTQHDWYAVAYDGDGAGITSLVLVQVAEGAVFDPNQIIAPHP